MIGHSNCNRLCRAVFFCLASFANAGSGNAASADLCFRGLNLSGAEYGELDGVEGVNFIYPSTSTVNFFADKGFDSVRLPFKWERLQPRLGGAFDQTELERLKASVNGLRGKGLTVVLDPHNYAYYSGQMIGSAAVPTRQFAQFWIRLAAEFANEDGIAFGLMNEPHDIAPAVWLDAVNRAIAGIRAVGARNLVLVPGTHWSGVVSWPEDFGRGSNATTMLGVVDPIDNYAFEVHQYMDKDLSGTNEACVNADLAVDGIVKLSEWLRTHDKRAFLGEFGGSKDADCLAGLTRMMDQMAEDSDVWLGWTYWAGGDWWSPDEGNNIQPTEAGDRAQLSVLLPALEPAAADPGACVRIPPAG
ncbi:glycoside hydrolase family 5 protein [Rhizobium rhizophilum]|uniref:Glycoside hydrolase family 5 protein n=1 Tax=Rhizobium rhizophilum TaxID=1850373 RepID=A0ABY2QXU4_9HYPH|nr:glycoside hydrolase family 5 protein [Rhizobium rhizophilum]THV15785.1 glycoside hydrolase family 5 protein [Rhizobium rhizophilum]